MLAGLSLCASCALALLDSPCLCSSLYFCFALFPPLLHVRTNKQISLSYSYPPHTHTAPRRKRALQGARRSAVSAFRRNDEEGGKAESNVLTSKRRPPKNLCQKPQPGHLRHTSSKLTIEMWHVKSLPVSNHVWRWCRLLQTAGAVVHSCRLGFLIQKFKPSLTWPGLAA